MLATNQLSEEMGESHFPLHGLGEKRTQLTGHSNFTPLNSRFSKEAS